MSTAPTPTWYDVLGVDPDADSEQIRAAWRAAIADLDPTDRRFQTCNRAAEVLLDPERRAAYDAELAAHAPTESEPQPEPEPEPEPGTPTDPSPDRQETPVPAERVTGGRMVPAWLLVGVGLLTAAMVGVAAYLHFAVPSDDELADATRAARAAAERAVVPVLSYDAASLEESREAAESYLTPAYRKEYAHFFEGVMKQNAEQTGTVVEAKLVRSGIVRSGEDRVEVFVLVDQSTTNKQRTTPSVIRYWVTMTVQRVGEEWLVAEMRTRA